MRVLSLFDGISCAMEALKRAGIKVDTYFASEIDKYAIQISEKNHPNILQLGDVTKIGYDAGQFCKKNEQGECNTMGVDFIEDIDLMIGGSPCQNLSVAGNQKGLGGDESKLFFEFVRLIDEVKPKYFILENVASMNKRNRDEISDILGVEPVMINASLVSAQDRKRLFWIGKYIGQTPMSDCPIYEKVEIEQPEDRGILLKDIITDDGEDITERMKKKVKGTLAYKKTWSSVRTLNQKAKTLTRGGQGIANSGATNIDLGNGRYKKPTPIECERLQGLPDNYTQGISNTQRYACLGNAFNVDVVAHILSFIPKQ